MTSFRRGPSQILSSNPNIAPCDYSHDTTGVLKVFGISDITICSILLVDLLFILYIWSRCMNVYFFVSNFVSNAMCASKRVLLFQY